MFILLFFWGPPESVWVMKWLKLKVENLKFLEAWKGKTEFGVTRRVENENHPRKKKKKETTKGKTLQTHGWPANWSGTGSPQDPNKNTIAIGWRAEQRPQLLPPKHGQSLGPVTSSWKNWYKAWNFHWNRYSS